MTHPNRDQRQQTVTHADRDQDLLMFAHGELAFLPALRLQRHLSGCPDCRRRLAALNTVSAGFAGVIGSRRGPWTPRRITSRDSLITAALLAATVALVIAAFIVHHQVSHASAPPPASTPCRADLPSDRCR